MRLPSLFVMALVVLCVRPAFADDKKAEADLKAMVGKWSVEKAELGGKDITEGLKVLKFEIRAGGNYTAEHGEEKDVGTFTVDASKKPKELDVKPSGGPLKGKIVKGIYKIDGDTLIICYQHDIAAGARPTTFESKANSSLLLIKYKRVK